MDPGKNIRIAARPVGLDGLIGQIRFHQDDREIEFLVRYGSLRWETVSVSRHVHPLLSLNKKIALSSW